MTLVPGAPPPKLAEIAAAFLAKIARSLLDLKFVQASSLRAVQECQVGGTRQGRAG
jgi:hypothetical protein